MRYNAYLRLQGSRKKITTIIYFYFCFHPQQDTQLINIDRVVFQGLEKLWMLVKDAYEKSWENKEEPECSRGVVGESSSIGEYL